VTAKRRAHGQGSIYRRADGRWEAKVDLPPHPTTGARRRRKVVAATRAEATRRLDELRGHTSAGAVSFDGSLTVAGWLERWAAELPRTVAATTAANYADVVRLYIEPGLGRHRLVTLTSEDVAEWMRGLEQAGRSPRTVQLARAVLRRSLRVAEQRGLVARNVAALVDGPKLQRAEGRALTRDQADRLLDTIAGHRLETAIVLALTLGLRPGEVLGLRWDDLDLAAEHPSLTVNVSLKRIGPTFDLSAPKTPKSRRRLRLTTFHVDMLREHHRHQAADRLALGPEWGADGWADVGLVFTTAAGRPVDRNNLRHAFQRLTEQAGLGRWSPHELRHSATSLMLGQGARLATVSDALGHASIRLTKDTYGHLEAETTAEVTNALGADLLGRRAERLDARRRP
jgi:integrase